MFVMKKILFLTSLILFTVDSMSQSTERAEKLLIKAEKAFLKENYERTKELLSEAANLDYMPAEFLLGTIAFDNSDYETALSHYFKASNNGFEPAIQELALLNIDPPLGYKKNLKKAREYIAKLKNPTEGAVLYQLAECYYNGYADYEIDKLKAFDLYMKAGDRGYGMGYMKVSEYYEKGEGVNKDEYKYKFYRVKAMSEINKTHFNAAKRIINKPTKKTMDTTKRGWETLNEMK